MSVRAHGHPCDSRSRTKPPDPGPWSVNRSLATTMVIDPMRRVTLTSRAKQSVWLYAPLPVGTNRRAKWDLRVLDAPSKGKTGAVLASLTIQPTQAVPAIVRVIGVVGRAWMGYESDDPIHESTLMLRGIQPSDLADRWHGLSMLDGLIWTPEGERPDSAQIHPGTHRAMLRWIDRGGHLIIVMPSAGDPWSRSFLAEAFPKSG